MWIFRLRSFSRFALAVAMVVMVFSASEVAFVSEVAYGATPNVLTIANSSLSLTFHTDLATLTVVDLRTNMSWNQEPVSKGIKVEKAAEQPGLITTTLFFPYWGTGFRLNATIKLQGDTPEFTVTLAASGNMGGSLYYPQPFVTEKGTYLVVPLNEGISYPVEDTSISHMQLWAYAGGGMSMAFWGVTDGEKGQMTIIQTPNDARIQIDRDSRGNLCVTPIWDSQKGQFGYTRSLRYVFFDHGGYVAMCKQYRAYAQAIGLVKTLQQKLQENPNVDLLIGAVSVWSAPPLEESYNGKLAIAKEMKALGMNRILFNTLGFSSAAVPPNAIQAMNNMSILTGRYDNYHDVMNPANLSRLSYSSPPYWWPEAAWPNDIVIGSDGKWIKGWSVQGKDGNQYDCGVVSDKETLKYAARIPEELTTHPYRARFIDTATSVPWLEDYSLNHSLTRSESRQDRMALLQYVSQQTGMVTGSEDGIDTALPYVHYFEGMLSLNPYRPRSGPISQILDTAPADEAKFQVGYTYRLPLWELVYHDCAVSYWYWNDYNNKMPSIWDKKDLFNILYGTPPMFMFNQTTWNSNKQRFLQSYNNICPVARQVGLSQMTDHRFLTSDRSVQQTMFENGVTITVNFGQAPYNLPDGTTIEPMRFQVSVPSGFDFVLTLARVLARELMNLMPFLALAGLIAVVCAVAFVKRRARSLSNHSSSGKSLDSDLKPTTILGWIEDLFPHSSSYNLDEAVKHLREDLSDPARFLLIVVNTTLAY